MLLACFMIYVLYCPLILQRKRLVQTVGALSYNHWDLGSIPRSLTLFIYFVSIYSYAVQASKPTIRSQSRHATWPLRAIQRPMFEEHHTHQSTRTRASRKSQKGLEINGPNCSTIPPIWRQHPPWFALFYSF